MITDAEIDAWVRADIDVAADDLADLVYSVGLWDHDPADDGSRPGEWSAKLARAHLGHTAASMPLVQLRKTLRHLLALGWSELSVRVSGEGADTPTLVEIPR